MHAKAYLLIPLASAFLYALAAVMFKRATDFKVGIWRTTFLSNWMMALLFTPWGLAAGTPPAGLNWSIPLLCTVLFFAGQVFTFLAIQHGDVSVATPVMGSKVVIVALFTVVVLGQDLGWNYWTAAMLTTTAILLLRAGPLAERRRLALGIGLALAAACCFALLDVLMQRWAPRTGFPTFVAILFGGTGLLSFALMPFFAQPLHRIPGPAWPWLGLGCVLLAIQSFGMALSIGVFGDAAAVNVVYSVRGLWSIGLVWGVGHWFGNRERNAGPAVMGRRLIAAVFMAAAVALVLLV